MAALLEGVTVGEGGWGEGGSTVFWENKEARGAVRCRDET